MPILWIPSTTFMRPSVCDASLYVFSGALRRSRADSCPPVSGTRSPSFCVLQQSRDVYFALEGRARLLASGLQVPPCVFMSLYLRLTNSLPLSARFVRIIYYNTQIIAMLFSLRFPGPSRPVLQECRRVAATVASLAVNWPDPSFRYASNFVAINIA